MLHRRGRGGKASGPWGRLKPVVQDPLESIGLPSKGDNTCVVELTAAQKQQLTVN